VELLGKSDPRLWVSFETYCIIVFALGCPAAGIYVLNLGLKEYDALHVVAIYESFLILCGSISGVIFFREDAGMQCSWQRILYPVSILTTIVGVIILSRQGTTHFQAASDDIDGDEADCHRGVLPSYNTYNSCGGSHRSHSHRSSSVKNSSSSRDPLTFAGEQAPLIQTRLHDNTDRR
jgi:hypothetical protein